MCKHKMHGVPEVDDLSKEVDRASKIRQCCDGSLALSDEWTERWNFEKLSTFKIFITSSKTDEDELSL